MARCLVRDLEPLLRQQLGLGTLPPDFLAELYLHVLAEIRARPPREALMSSLPLTVYFVAASQQPGDPISPDLIPNLREVIASTFEGISPFESVPPVSGQKEETRHDE